MFKEILKTFLIVVTAIVVYDNVESASFITSNIQNATAQTVAEYGIATVAAMIVAAIASKI